MDQHVLEILRNRSLFMGTIEENVPHVRPMKPYIDKEDHIWLISHADTKKIKEIEANNRVELCTLGAENEVVRISGELEPERDFAKNVPAEIKRAMFSEMPQLQEFFAGPEDTSIVVYRLKVTQIIFRDATNDLKSELNFR